MSKKQYTIIYLSWLVSFVATLGSLFFSEVMEYPPCVLCWYQRIAMYPLVIIFLVGAIQSIKDVIKFSMPLVALGWLIALYHNLIHWEIISEDLAPCVEGVACSTVYLDWGGFITIPLMSLSAFSILFVLSILFKREA